MDRLESLIGELRILAKMHAAGRIRLAGTIKIGLREDADLDEMPIDYLPRIEILEDENLSVGEDLNVTQLKITEGKAKIINRDKRKIITGIVRKEKPISIFIESETTNPDWVLAYREELKSTLGEET